jgi:hypothetical protein
MNTHYVLLKHDEVFQRDEETISEVCLPELPSTQEPM